ncbi:hypothetical protein J7643_03525 [bacterium]|nr:hypothetical protein [bacterium]
MAPTSVTHPQDWSTYFTVILEKQGRDKLRRVKTRLYEKLEAINEEIDDMEEQKELFLLPEHPELVPFIDQQVETLLSAGRALSIQLEQVIGLLEEDASHSM